jgi:hypothetical protein
MGSVPSSQAEDINQAMDAGIAGTWSDTGRVRYSQSTQQLYVLVHY